MQETVAHAVEAVLREDRGRLLAALIARFRDFQLAEDALQEAAASALVHWGRVGLPQSPQGWLLKVAGTKAIDRLRQTRREGDKAAAIAILSGDEAEADPEMIPDNRLRLIFTCCHPALEPKSRVALTLRCIAGLTTADIARAFLDAEATMGQRLSRAKAKIAAAGIPFVIPGPDDWDERLQSVLAVIYLIFNAGYTAGPDEPRALCAEAIYLARMIAGLRPGDAEIEGCLALMLITDARQAARLSQGASVALSDQDRSLWDRAAMAEGVALIDRAMARRTPGPYQIKAAIAACHVQGDAPDWAQIALLYASLYRMEPTPVVQLNRAVALAETGQVQVALGMLQSLSGALADYQPYHAARAEYLSRSGDAAARAAYDRAIALASNPADSAWLRARRDALPGGSPSAAT